jgi:HSP20 family protein
VSEDDRGVTVRVDVPGLEPKDLDVDVSGNVLTIRGSRSEEHEDKRHHRRERVSGSFVRSIPLPAHVDAAALEARYDKGVLTVTAPRIPGKGPKRVAVTAT